MSLTIRRNVILIILLSIQHCIFAQEVFKTDISQYCHLDTVISFKNEKGGMTIVPAMTSYGSTFAFTCYNARSNSDTIVVYLVNSNTYQTDTLNLIVDGLSHYLSKHYASGFKGIALRDSCIVLSTYNRIFVFRHNEGNNWYRDKTLRVNFDYKRMKMIDGRTLLFTDAYHSRRKHKTTMLLYDIEKGRKVKAIHPYLNSSLNTYYANFSYADYCEGRIVWAHNNEYSLVVYDRDLKPVDSIHYDLPNWRPLPDSVVRKAGSIPWTDAVDIIYTVQNKNVKSDIIMWTLFLDKDTLLVVRKTPNARHKLIDLWSYTEGHWQPQLCGISDAGFWLDLQSLVKDRFQIGFSAGDYVTVCGNKLFALTTMAWTDTFGNRTGKEYAKAREEYLLEDNDYFVQLRIYTYDFNQQQR